MFNGLDTGLGMDIRNQVFTLQTGDLPLNPEQVSWEDEAYITSTGMPSTGLRKLVYLFQSMKVNLNSCVDGLKLVYIVCVLLKTSHIL